MQIPQKLVYTKFCEHKIAAVDLSKNYFLKNAKKTCKPNNRDLNRDWINKNRCLTLLKHLVARLVYAFLNEICLKIKSVPLFAPNIFAKLLSNLTCLSSYSIQWSYLFLLFYQLFLTEIFCHLLLYRFLWTTEFLSLIRLLDLLSILCLCEEKASIYHLHKLA